MWVPEPAALFVFAFGSFLRLDDISIQTRVSRLDEGSQPLVAGWVSAKIQVIEIERARKTFKLDLGGLGLGFSEVV